MDLYTEKEDNHKNQSNRSFWCISLVHILEHRLGGSLKTHAPMKISVELTELLLKLTPKINVMVCRQCNGEIF